MEQELNADRQNIPISIQNSKDFAKFATDIDSVVIVCHVAGKHCS